MARKQKTIHYIYKTSCDVTNRYYVGMHSTNDLNDGYMGSGRRLRASIRKHGEDNHTKEVLEFYDSRELLIEAEKKAITPEMIGDNNCMNLMGGGEGGFISEEQQRYRSSCAGKALAAKRKDDPELNERYLKMASDNFKRAHSEGKIKYDTFTGRKHSAETIDKMRVSKNVGKDNPSYGSCWITRDGSNKKVKKDVINEYLEEGWVRGRKI